MSLASERNEPSVRGQCVCRHLLPEDAPPLGGVERDPFCPVHGSMIVGSADRQLVGELLTSGQELPIARAHETNLQVVLDEISEIQDDSRRRRALMAMGEIWIQLVELEKRRGA